MKSKYPYEFERNGAKFVVNEKTLFMEYEARIMIGEAGKDPDSGMEYLNGLEFVDPLGNKLYKREDIERFINK